jgi:hypothetical protein
MTAVQANHFNTVAAQARKDAEAGRMTYDRLGWRS